MSDSSSPASGVMRGTRLYWRINVALFMAGFATFTLLYCVQPLLPLFAQHFQVGAAQSSLALSLSTGALALAIFCAGAISEGRDRRRLMFTSLLLAAACNLAAALIGQWHGLLAARLLAGVALGGVPAVALAYLAEEVDPRGLGLSIGLYVSGTAFGGMAGRIVTSFLADHWDWQTAMVSLSLFDLLMAAGFALLLPPSVHPPASGRGLPLSAHMQIWREQLRHPALPGLFAIGFLGMGVFVTTYNYAGFRLMAAPFNLSASHIGLIFCAYVFGIASSSLAGGLADRHGQAPVMRAGVLISAAGVLLSLWPAVVAAVGGIVLLTFGFFMVHAVASGWVGRLAGARKGHAASLYLLAYYLGSSILGSCGGWFWEHGGWPAVVAVSMAALALAWWSLQRVRAATTGPVHATLTQVAST